MHKPFYIDAWVVLPDHMHAVLTLPEGDSDYSGRWREIKKRFSKGLPKNEHVSLARINKNERGIWQRRFWEHTIVDEREPKEAGRNLQEEQERRQVVREVKGLLRQLRQLGRWTVKVKAKTASDDDEGKRSRQNWESEIQPRDSRAGLHDNTHGTLISKGW